MADLNQLLLLEEGQIWREAAEKNMRLVVVITSGAMTGKATIRTCDEKGEPMPGSLPRKAKTERFNNKSNGYIFVGKAKTAA